MRSGGGVRPYVGLCGTNAQTQQVPRATIASTSTPANGEKDGDENTKPRPEVVEGRRKLICLVL